MAGRRVGGPSGYQQAMAALDALNVPREAWADGSNGLRRKTHRLSLTERIQILGRIVPPLMGAKEVAECLGTTTSNLPAFARLPKAVAELRSGRVWLASDIEEFAEERRRARGERAGKGTET